MVSGIAAATVTPRMAVGGVHVGLGDLLGFAGSCSWLASWVVARTEPLHLSDARWPALAVCAGLVSLTTSRDVTASIVGLVELIAIWVLPTFAIAALFADDMRRRRLLWAVSGGTLAAAALNLVTAVQMGFTGGLPQVWGAADGWQGYFQVCGIAIAVLALMNALAEHRRRSVAAWSCALALHTIALLLTQTRGAWLAAVVMAATFGFIWRRAFAVSAALFAVIAVVLALGTDWGAVVRERILSVFRPETNLSGFDSSIIRAGLALTALNMFFQHPLTGIGLKSFPLALPYYAPTGLPLAVEMGPNQVLIPIQGPHSTYLSLLAETGLLGGLAVLAWVVSAWWGAWQWARRADSSTSLHRQLGGTVCGAVSAIAVFNLFGELNAAGGLPLVMFLALGTVLRRDPARGRAA